MITSDNYYFAMTAQRAVGYAGKYLQLEMNKLQDHIKSEDREALMDMWKV